MSYLISVVVPTRNRYCYLKHLILLIDSFKLDKLELVIQDNSDDNKEILEFLKTISNENIRYFYSNKKLSMSENSDLAVLNSSGKYVCFIGDDDGVCRNIVDCAKWMSENKIEVVFSKVAWYFWNGRIKLFKHHSNIKYYDASKELKHLLKIGFNLSRANVPLLYHAIVLRTKLMEIYSKAGTFFPYTPPDISGAVSLSLFVEKYCEINVPIIINGISNMAGGGVLKEGGVLPLEKVSFINEKDIRDWEKELPPIWCGDYAWANAGIKTLRILGYEKLLHHLNLEYCLAGAVATRPHKIELIKKSFRYSSNHILLTLYILKILILRYLTKIKNNNKLNVIQANNIKTIIEAETFFMQHNKFLFNKV